MTDPSENLRSEFLREIRRRMRSIRGIVREQVGQICSDVSIAMCRVSQSPGNGESPRHAS